MKYFWYITAGDGNLQIVKVAREDKEAFEKEQSERILVGPADSLQEAILEFQQRNQ